MMQGHAQNNNSGSSGSFREEFDKFRKEQKGEFENFRAKIKAEHIEFVRQAWQEFQSARPVPKPKDETVPPVVMPKGQKPKPLKNRQVVIDEVVKPVKVSPTPQPEPRPAPVTKPAPQVNPSPTPDPLPAPAPETQPKLDLQSQNAPSPVSVVPREDNTIVAPVLDPIVIQPLMIEPVVIEPVKPIHIDFTKPIEIGPVKSLIEDKAMEVMFYGTPVKIHFDTENMVHLKGISENNVADALKKLSGSKAHGVLLDNCIAIRKGLKLNDWAYLQFLKTVAYKLGNGCTNESTLLLAYLYMCSGYKMRLAKDDSRLYMLYCSTHQIYDMPSYSLDGDSYYGVEKLPSSLYICKVTFDKQFGLSLVVNQTPLLKESITEERVVVSNRYPDVKVTISVNKNLLDFFESYPSSMYGDNMMTRWAIYADTPLEGLVKSQLYPQLKKHIEGKSQLEAVNILLNWIQTGFEYEYDNTVWGGDRAFFSEETLYYPYCDCEDRSILFTRIVRDLLGLKCLLVYYPGHLASAVCFNEDVSGDYIQIDGDKYVIADGTYINANVGSTMPGMDNATAKVIVLE